MFDLLLISVAVLVVANARKSRVIGDFLFGFLLNSCLDYSLNPHNRLLLLFDSRQ